MLKVSQLSVSYSGNRVLDNVSLKVTPGTITGLLGANGSGKSTLIKAVLGLVDREGQAVVSFAGAPLEQCRRQISYMPQQAELDWNFPINVMDLALMGRVVRLPWWRRPSRADKKLAYEALERTDTATIAHRPVRSLSGGQRQRVLLARALASQPDCVILDEPFAGVDAASQSAIVTILKQLRDAGKTILIVHHNLSEVTSMCDEVILLAHKHVIASGPTSTTLTDEAVTELFALPC